MIHENPILSTRYYTLTDKLELTRSMKTVISNSRVEPVKMGTMAQPADIFHLSKKGDSVMSIKLWLDNTENDINQVDDHWFTPLHWAARYGHKQVVELLIDRGARVSAKNRGDDTPLHNACQCGHLEIAKTLIRHKATLSLLNERNEHGNSPLHYACFGNYR
jgi:integrin-linked kinase